MTAEPAPPRRPAWTVTLLVGPAVPVLGASLIGFLVLDGLVQSWRAPATAHR